MTSKAFDEAAVLLRMRAEALAVSAPVKKAQDRVPYRDRHVRKRLGEGRKQLNAGFVHEKTIEELKWLQNEWGFASRTEVIDIAIRRLYQQTKQGLQRLDFSDDMPP